VLLPKIIKCRFNYYRKLQCRLYEAYGNEQNITPFLDSLAKSLLLLIFMLQEIEQCRFRSRKPYASTAGESVKEKTIKQIFNGKRF
jgi:hypothetical protein